MLIETISNEFSLTYFIDIHLTHKRKISTNIGFHVPSKQLDSKLLTLYPVGMRSLSFEVTLFSVTAEKPR